MSHHILIIIVITVLLVPSTKSTECPGSVFGNHCYVILTDVSQWEESKLSCDQQYGGHQPIIDSQDQADFLADLARREDSESIWINARKDEQHWHWLEDSEDVTIQGCYADSSQEADLPYMVYIDDMTPDLCVEECRMEHYLYAGLQDGDKCFCGDNFGRYGQVTSSDVEWCTSDCAGDRDQNCGGRHLNMIYKVDGAYGVWAFRQPNNWSGHQDCGALASIDDQYKFGDENCYELMYYLCDIGCSDDSSSLCMYVSDEEVTWFDARADCLERGGELTSILSEPRHAELSDFLYENGHSLEKHWIGLTKFQWLDQHDVPLSFTDFADRSPNQEDANCLVMSNEHNYRWIDEMCSEERATICQIDDTTNRRTSTIIYPNRETPTPTPTPTPSNTPVIFSPHGSTPSLSPLIRSTTPQLGVTSSNQSASSPGYETTNNETMEYGNSTAGDENSTDIFTTKTPSKQEQEIVNSDSEAATGIKGEFLKLSLFDILLLAVLLALAVGIFSCAIVFAVFKRNHRTNQISDNKAVEQTDEVKAPPTDLFTTNASRANQYKGSMRRLTEYPDDDGTTC